MLHTRFPFGNDKIGTSRLFNKITRLIKAGIPNSHASGGLPASESVNRATELPFPATESAILLQAAVCMQQNSGFLQQACWLFFRQMALLHKKAEKNQKIFALVVQLLILFLKISLHNGRKNNWSYYIY